MELYQVERRIVEGTKKGAWQNLTWQKELKLYKKFENEDIKITKISQGIVKFGCEYDNLKSTREKRENGELPQDNQGLNGLEWLKYPYLLKGIKSNKTFLRVTLQADSPIVTRYFKNGIEVTKEEIIEYCLASNFPTGEKPSVINIDINNIVELKEKVA